VIQEQQQVQQPRPLVVHSQISLLLLVQHRLKQQRLLVRRR